MATEVNLARGSFSGCAQESFARASGDRNPIHLDAVIARRTQAGACVVHGVHGTLWALENLCANGAPLAALSSLNVRFLKFLYLEKEVVLRVTRRDDRTMLAELTAGSMVVTKLNMGFGARVPSPLSIPLGSAAPAPPSLIPTILSLEVMEHLSGWLLAPRTELAELFPRLCNTLGYECVESLALLSTLVGMECPGMHSIFSSFSAKITDGTLDRQGLGWRTSRIDERFGLVWMDVWGGNIVGEVQAFIRPKPVVTPSIRALQAQVKNGEFFGRHALIVGGSRGLGAVTAKLLAAGGARVFVTYATGAAEASDLVDDICGTCGRWVASAVRCDVTSDIASQLRDLPDDLTHLYYFATPRIQVQGNEAFSLKRFARAASFYLDGFWNVASHVAARSRIKPLSVLYPSTDFLHNRPTGMTEYTMAKAAGEVLASDFALTFGARVSAPRIPRVLTDQTAAIVPLKTADAVDVMLPLLRAER